MHRQCLGRREEVFPSLSDFAAPSGGLLAAAFAGAIVFCLEAQSEGGVGAADAFEPAGEIGGEGRLAQKHAGKLGARDAEAAGGLWFVKAVDEPAIAKDLAGTASAL